MELISNLRKEVDLVDTELAKLLNRRYLMAKLIVDLKKSEHLEIDDLDREVEIINRVKSIAQDIPTEIIERIYTDLFRASKGGTHDL